MMDYSNFILGTITGIVSAIIVALARFVFIRIYYHKSKYSGKWVDEIYDNNGNLIKSDICILKHHKRNNTLSGKIKRTYPTEQTHRHWKCSGVLNGEHIILTFWSSDIIKSDGCVYATFSDDFVYEGYYLKSDNNTVEKVRIKLYKDLRKSK